MKKRYLAGLMAALALVAAPMSVSAANNVDEYQDLTESTTAEAEVTITNNTSEFSVKIPKKMSGEGMSGSLLYDVEVSGDIAGNEIVKCSPSESVELRQVRKATVTASITQEKQGWYVDEFMEHENEVVGQGKVDYEGLKAGTYKGSFNFTIELQQIADEAPEAPAGE